MPTYEYLCKKCGNTFEEFQPMSAEPLTRCPKCGTDNLARVMGTGGGIIFKGSGFYITDYRKTGGASAGDGAKRQTEKKEKDSRTGAAEGKPAETKTEEKSGEKKEPGKKETGKGDAGKGTPPSQPSSPPPAPEPPKKKD
jgi:putative FmdB family regulatory protein